jgi:hypothetical protein
MKQKEKEKIINKLFKLHDINDVKILFKKFNKYAEFNIDKSTLVISTNKVSLNDKKTFIKIILHEIDHILMCKKYTKEKFKQMYKEECKAQKDKGFHPIKNNKYEKQANEFSDKKFFEMYQIFE